MESIVKLNEDVNKLTDKELIDQFKSAKPMFGKMNYYPVFADRISKFKGLLFEEVVKEENLSERVMGAINVGWVIALSMLDRVESEKIKSELAKKIKKSWPSEEYSTFLNYLSSMPDFLKYFDKEIH